MEPRKSHGIIGRTQQLAHSHEGFLLHNFYIMSASSWYTFELLFRHLLNQRWVRRSFIHSRGGVWFGPYHTRYELCIGSNMLSCVGHYHLWESQRSWNVRESYIVLYIREDKSCLSNHFGYHDCWCGSHKSNGQPLNACIREFFLMNVNVASTIMVVDHIVVALLCEWGLSS